MSRHTPPPNQGEEMDRTQQYEDRLVELERGEQAQPQLKWVVVENPDQTFLLEEDDYILDSHFNPEYDIWEVLIRLESDDDE